MFGVPNIVFPKGTILDQVLEEYRSNPDPPEDQDEVERTLLVCGSDGVGKTTLIQKVTDTSEEVSPTVFIDYSFGVKKDMGEGNEIGVCNTWELGSGAVFAPLLNRVPVGGQCRGCNISDSPLNSSAGGSGEEEGDNNNADKDKDDDDNDNLSEEGGKDKKRDVIAGRELILGGVDIGGEEETVSICGLAVVLMLDLSQPTTLWHTLRSVLSAISKYIDSRPDAEHIKTRVLDSIDKKHPDSQFFKPYCAPLIIIGGKYDIFQEFEPEQKRIICRCLRMVAHLSYGYLVFYSDLHNDLTKLTLDILYHYGYGTNPPVKGVVTEHTEPLHIPPGKDNLDSIRSMSGLSLSDLEDIPHVLSSYFPQEDPWGTYFKKNTKDNFQFRDPVIEAYRKEKDEELERMIKHSEEEEEKKAKRQAKAEAGEEAESGEEAKPEAEAEPGADEGPEAEVEAKVAQEEGSSPDNGDSLDSEDAHTFEKHFSLLLPRTTPTSSLAETPTEDVEEPKLTEN